MRSPGGAMIKSGQPKGSVKIQSMNWQRIGELLRGLRSALAPVDAE